MFLLEFIIKVYPGKTFLLELPNKDNSLHTAVNGALCKGVTCDML